MRHETMNVPVAWNFESLDELCEFACTRRDRRARKASQETGSLDWYGSNTFEEAIEFAKRGWPKGTEMVYAMREQMGIRDVSSLVGESEVLVNDVMGGAVDMDHYLEGEPECMLFPEERTGHNPRVVTVVVNLAASCSVRGSELNRRGAACGVLVDALESYGIRCEIIALDYNSWCPDAWYNDPEIRHPKGGSIVRTVVKRANELFDIDRVAYALVNPGMLRRHMFAVHESQPDVPSGYGMPKSVTSDDMAVPHIMVPTMSGSRSEWASDERAIAWIRKALEPYLVVD